MSYGHYEHIPELKKFMEEFKIPLKHLKHIKRKQKQLDLNEIIKRNEQTILKNHVHFLDTYRQVGWDKAYNNGDNPYFNRLKKLGNLKTDAEIEEKTKKFVELLHSIEKQGFLNTKDPVMLVDMKSFGIKPLEYRYYRINGSHRCSIAHVLGITKLPVQVVSYKK
jgi:hypothetical protein